MISANATDPDNDVPTYQWTNIGGKVTGSGKTVVWDLSGAAPGVYSLAVEVNDGQGYIARDSISVEVRSCDDCKPCPRASVIGDPAKVDAGQPITFTAQLDNPTEAKYKWLVSPGTITSGQGTSSITVDSTGLDGKTIIATVELKDVGDCKVSSSGTAIVAGRSDVHARIRRLRRASFFTGP